VVNALSDLIAKNYCFKLKRLVAYHVIAVNEKDQVLQGWGSIKATMQRSHCEEIHSHFHIEHKHSYIFKERPFIQTLHLS